MGPMTRVEVNGVAVPASSVDLRWRMRSVADITVRLVGEMVMHEEPE
jgi:hypothetical protein